MNSVLACSVLKCCAVYVFKGFKNLANCHKLKSFFVCLFVCFIRNKKFSENYLVSVFVFQFS